MYRCYRWFKCLLNSLVQTPTTDPTWWIWMRHKDSSKSAACFSSLVLVADLYSVLYASDPRQSTESHESFRSHDLQASLPALLFNTLKSTFGIYVFSPSCCYCILSLAHHRRGLFLGLHGSDQLVEPRWSWFSHITSTHGRTFSPPLPSTAQ